MQRLLCVKIVLAYSIKNTGPAILNAIETVAGIVGISIMDYAAAFTAAPGAAVAGQGDNAAHGLGSFGSTRKTTVCVFKRSRWAGC